MMISLEEFKGTEWYQEQPGVIKHVIELIPPIQFYKFSNGKQCYVLSYDEPVGGKTEDITLTVQKTGLGGVFPLGPLDNNKVFGVRIDDLSPWTE
jgi:hypothetical protein